MKFIYLFEIFVIICQVTIQDSKIQGQQNQKQQQALENTKQDNNPTSTDAFKQKVQDNFHSNQQIVIAKEDEIQIENEQKKQQVQDMDTDIQYQLVLQEKKVTNDQNQKKRNYDFCEQNIIRNFLYRQYNFVQPKKLESKSPFCPNITHSCCTLREIEELANIFQNNANSVKKLFSKIRLAFYEYVKDKNIVFDYLKQISSKDEECSGHSKDELISLFKLHINNYQLRSKAIDRFEYFTLRMQSGFVCSMCDISQQRSMVLKDRLMIELRQINCSKIFNEKLKFSSVIYSLYNLVKVVRGVQCHIQKSSQKFQGSSMDLFYADIEKVKRCLTDFSVQTALRGSICQSLCQNIFNYNKVQNIDNIFNFANQLLDFKSHILDKKKGIFNPQINHSSDVQVMLVPPRKKKISFRMNDVDYTVSRSGIDLYNNHLHLSSLSFTKIFATLMTMVLLLI